MNPSTEKPAVPVSEMYALMHSKCPRCRRGNMFANSMYGFNTQKMYDNCPHCNLKFEREPGYFYVAMFISYALNVVQMLIAGYGTFLITGNTENPWLYMATIFPFVFLLAPFNYRFSRLLLLYYMTPGLKYVPEYSRDKKSEI